MTINIVTGVPGAMLAEVQAAGRPLVKDIPMARRHFDLGRVYFKQKQYEKAIEAFEEAYKLSNRPELLYDIALCYKRLARPEAAITYFQRYLDGQPDTDVRKEVEIDILFFIGLIEERKINLPPPDPNLLTSPEAYQKAYREGIIKYNNGEYEKAIESFGHTLETNLDANIFYPLGLSYLKLEKYEEAISAFENYLGEISDAPHRDLLSKLIPLLKKRLSRKQPVGTQELQEVILQVEAEVEAKPPPSSFYKKMMWGSAVFSVAGLFLGGRAFYLAKKNEREHNDRVDNLIREGEIVEHAKGDRFASEKAQRRYQGELDQTEAQAKRQQTIAIIGFASGAILAASAGIFYWLDGRVKVVVEPNLHEVKAGFLVEF